LKLGRITAEAAFQKCICNACTSSCGVLFLTSLQTLPMLVIVIYLFSSLHAAFN